MSKKTFRNLVIIWLICGTTMVGAGEIAVIEIAESWATESGSGFALDLFTEINKVVDLPLEITPVPFSRAIKMFKEKQATCYLGGDKKAAWDYMNMHALESTPFFEGRVEVFTLRSQPIISSVDTLKTKIIGVQRAVHSLMKNLKHLELNYATVNSTLQNYFKLQKGRIDAFIGYGEHLPSEMSASIHNDPGFVLYANNESLVCHVTKSNQRIIDTFNKGLAEIKSNGTFQALYKKYFGM
ncbi:MAG: transporter substrate-binding domain-containing protein [Fibrobacterales bacterium]